jgi:flagellar L-ring protein precursor FlgH
VGDTLTINIVERVSATQTSTSELSKTGSLSAGVTALPGISTNSFGRASARATSANDNKGKGSNQNTNDFRHHHRRRHRRAAQRPPDDQRREADRREPQRGRAALLRPGRPARHRPGQRVPSTSVANVRIEQRGRGATSDAHAVGWLSRFFLNSPELMGPPLPAAPAPSRAHAADRRSRIGTCR